uniref:Anticoagulant peptide 1 n=1 Tax=Ancylostoma duodenale TaxID=51022 RepID=G4RIK2_9BILA|nr:anticoagulant peptide 1 precursor [Ancylostoma duodenale]
MVIRSKSWRCNDHAIEITLLLVSQCSAKATKNCGDNEQFDKCGMKECDLRCKIEQSEKEEPSAECLARVCNPGACLCKAGYYRNREDRCVTEDVCQEDFMEFIYPEQD